jgi:hypothetical protein
MDYIVMKNKKYSRKVQRYLIMLTNTILWKNCENITNVQRHEENSKDADNSMEADGFAGNGLEYKP